MRLPIGLLIPVLPLAQPAVPIIDLWGVGEPTMPCSTGQRYTRIGAAPGGRLYVCHGGIWNLAGQMRMLFVQTTDVTVASSDLETSVVGTGVGSVMLPANFFSAGRTIQALVAGFYSTDTPAGTMTLRVRIGGTVIMATGINTMTNGMTDHYWAVRIMDITCRTDGVKGTIMAQGHAIFGTSKTTSDVLEFGPNLVPVVIDTTQNHVLDITVQWGTASAANTLTATNIRLMDLSQD